MISEIINGISQQIYATFGLEYEVYADEKISQGFANPCFFIALQECSKHNMIGERFALRCSFDIKYFPKEQNSLDEMFDVASLLFGTLEYIETESESKLHGTSMHYEGKDGILHFYVNYNLFRRTSGEPVLMENSTVGTKINLSD